MPLRKGARGPFVRNLQLKLIALGYPLLHYGPDGVLWDETLGAIVAFERAHQLPLSVDVVGDKTLQALAVAYAALEPKGIDVSRWQGEIDWSMVGGAGLAFAFIRATEALYTDPLFAGDWAAAGRAGILRGAYLAIHPHVDPGAQASLFAKVVKPTPGDGTLPPVLDIEVIEGCSRAEISKASHACLDALEEAFGRKPIVYTAPRFAEAYLTSDFGAYPLWVAHYGVKEPEVPKGWERWTFWQGSCQGHVAGIGVNVDLDVFQGTAAELAALARP